MLSEGEDASGRSGCFAWRRLHTQMMHSNSSAGCTEHLDPGFELLQRAHELEHQCFAQPTSSVQGRCWHGLQRAQARLPPTLQSFEQLVLTQNLDDSPCTDLCKLLASIAPLLACSLRLSLPSTEQGEQIICEQLVKKWCMKSSINQWLSDGDVVEVP